MATRTKPQTLGADLKAAREERGLTQNDIGEATGLGQSNLSKLERGEREPQPEQILAIMEATGRREARGRWHGRLVKISLER